MPKTLISSSVTRFRELDAAHPDRFLFDKLPGAGKVLAPRLCSSLSGVGLLSLAELPLPSSHEGRP
jgi:hypothetical protein